MPSMTDLALIVALLFTATAALALSTLAVMAPDPAARRRAERLLELLLRRRQR